MSRFLQLHALTFYPPSNLNRDDLGRPKTATVGGAPRLRISSQCLKRSWRTSAVFEETLAGNIGTRTKRIGSEIVYPRLLEGGIDEKRADDWTQKIAAEFGKLQKKDKKDPTAHLETEQLVHFSPMEISQIHTLVDQLIERQSEPTKEELAELHQKGRSVDIALFGRMLAEHPATNVDAAAQVAHAITVNRVALEDDFFTAVDDLNPEGETGAGHVDEHWYGSGTFYLYVCVNRDLLIENLGGDEALANQALRALTKAMATVSPSGKQNSFAALARASYVRAEKGNAAPRSLSIAFVDEVWNANPEKSITRLEDTRKELDEAYESAPAKHYCFKPGSGSKLSELLNFVAEA